MRNFINFLVRDYGWVHLSLGLLGNIQFLIGSVLFLPSLERWQTVAVYLFIGGAALMMVGALGQLLVKVLER